MKQRLADYVADFLAAHGVTDVFSVVGDGIRSLTDVLSRWQNSIPTVAVSGQMRYSTTVKKDLIIYTSATGIRGILQKELIFINKKVNEVLYG